METVGKFKPSEKCQKILAAAKLPRLVTTDNFANRFLSFPIQPRLMCQPKAVGIYVVAASSHVCVQVAPPAVPLVVDYCNKVPLTSSKCQVATWIEHNSQHGIKLLRLPMTNRANPVVRDLTKKMAKGTLAKEKKAYDEKKARAEHIARQSKVYQRGEAADAAAKELYEILGSDTEVAADQAKAKSLKEDREAKAQASPPVTPPARALSLTSSDASSEEEKDVAKIKDDSKETRRQAQQKYRAKKKAELEEFRAKYALALKEQDRLKRELAKADNTISSLRGDRDNFKRKFAETCAMNELFTKNEKKFKANEEAFQVRISELERDVKMATQLPTGEGTKAKLTFYEEVLHTIGELAQAAMEADEEEGEIASKVAASK